MRFDFVINLFWKLEIYISNEPHKEEIAILIWSQFGTRNGTFAPVFNSYQSLPLKFLFKPKCQKFVWKNVWILFLENSENSDVWVDGFDTTYEASKNSMPHFSTFFSLQLHSIFSLKSSLKMHHEIRAQMRTRKRWCLVSASVPELLMFIYYPAPHRCSNHCNWNHGYRRNIIWNIGS